jgi:hypothetical protein
LVRGLKVEYTEFLEVTDDTTELAAEYIAEGVVGHTSFADCLHIALATINRADYLISWNFKHRLFHFSQTRTILSLKR